MNKLVEYFRLILFVTGVLVGIQIPGFVDQYGKNLTARLSESELALQEFQRDADKYFAGDIEKLITHYEKQPDIIINAGGGNIRQLYNRQALLKTALNKFNESFYSKYVEVAVNPLIDVRQQVWQNYSYNIMLDASAITLGLLLGLIAAVLTELLLLSTGYSIRACWRKLRKKPQTA